MKKSKIKPTESELEILNILWFDGPSSVKELHAALFESKQVVYTTILKTLQNMYEKDLVVRESKGRGHVYAANVAQQDVQFKLTEELVKNAFMGNSSQLVLQALGQHSPSAEELVSIKALLDKLENDLENGNS